MPVEHFRQHPDVHQPWNEWSEDQKLYIMSVYNNPFRYQTRRKLFNDFRRQMMASPNVVFIPVELAYGERPFEVTDPKQYPFDVQVRTHGHEMFFKENLINIGMRHAPASWQYGGYWDPDFSMTRHDWALEAIHMLQHHAYVQNFSSYTDVTGSGATSSQGQRPFRINPSFAWNYLNQELFKKRNSERMKKGIGGDTYYAKLPPSKVFPFGLPPGATGGGWCWTKTAFNVTQGLLDTCPLGSADWHMAFGLIEGTNVAAEMTRCTQPYIQKVLQWQQRAAKLTRNIGCIDHHVVHHFHGSKSNRNYGTRWKILQDHAFDPDIDLTRDWQGVWQLSGNKPRLRDDIRRYFISRDEDNPVLQGGEAEIV